MKYVLGCVILFSLFFFYVLIQHAQGFEMQSSQYKIKWGNINIGASGQSAPGQYKLSTTIGQATAGQMRQFDDVGYVVSAGFQYWHTIIPFTFTVSKTNINLGTLDPNTERTDTATLSVSYGGAGFYQVTAIEEGKLSMMSGEFIIDTNCNSGCSETVANIWNSNTAYGFGYSMAGEDVPADFSDVGCTPNCYRRFADRTTGENPSVIMTSQNVTWIVPTITPVVKDVIHASTITFKGIASGTQTGGTYRTTITFVATPSI